MWQKSLFILIFLTSFLTHAQNTTYSSFHKSKKTLEEEVYTTYKQTIYCDAQFTKDKNVIAPLGFESTKYAKRTKRIEWEHIVPAENFGRTFSAWREGAAECVSTKGKSYKGRKCANKADKEYRYMQADMFNLYPAIGSVNAMRSNYNFTMLPSEESDFGSCEMKIANKKAEPPQQARGPIARTYLYMEQTYARYKMSKQQKKLMLAWDALHPVEKWECERTKLITKLQSNKNAVVQSACMESGLWL